MTDFYIPRTGKITIGGQTYPVVKGIHFVPDIVADSHEANAYGIKPTTEMTDDEWRLLGLVKPESIVPAPAPDPAPEPIKDLDVEQPVKVTAKKA